MQQSRRIPIFRDLSKIKSMVEDKVKIVLAWESSLHEITHNIKELVEVYEKVMLGSQRNIFLSCRKACGSFRGMESGDLGVRGRTRRLSMQSKARYCCGTCVLIECALYVSKIASPRPRSSLDY